jgi:hypothetical protein
MSKHLETEIRKLKKQILAIGAVIEESLDQLKTLCSTQVNVKGGGSCLRIPTPRPQSRQLLEAIAITLPEALPHRDLPVVTRKKLPENRPKP